MNDLSSYGFAKKLDSGMQYFSPARALPETPSAQQSNVVFAVLWRPNPKLLAETKTNELATQSIYSLWFDVHTFGEEAEIETSDKRCRFGIDNALFVSSVLGVEQFDVSAHLDDLISRIREPGAIEADGAEYLEAIEDAMTRLDDRRDEGQETWLNKLTDDLSKFTD